MSTADVIDTLVGIAPGSPLAAIRAARSQARDNAQASYKALFDPADPGQVSLAERFAVATAVAGWHDRASVTHFYADRLEAEATPALLQAVQAVTAAGRSEGPFGNYPAGPLSAENRPGATLHLSVDTRAALGNRLAAALEHAHGLVFHPRDAEAAALQKLLDAGWGTTAIVTLSQLVAFLSFQIRVVDGLSVLSAAQGSAA